MPFATGMSSMLVSAMSPSSDCARRALAGLFWNEGWKTKESEAGLLRLGGTSVSPSMSAASRCEEVRDSGRRTGSSLVIIRPRLGGASRLLIGNGVGRRTAGVEAAIGREPAARPSAGRKIESRLAILANVLVKDDARCDVFRLVVEGVLLVSPAVSTLRSHCQLTASSSTLKTPSCTEEESLAH